MFVLCTFLRSRIRLSYEMKAVGVFAVNDTRARLGSPALLTKLCSSPLVLQVACCYFLAGGFLFACARGFCARWGFLLILLSSSFSSHISTCSGAIPLVAPFLWFLPSVCLPTGDVVRSTCKKHRVCIYIATVSTATPEISNSASDRLQNHRSFFPRCSV